MAYFPGGPSVQGQVLEMTVVGCYNLSNKELLSRQDPYVVIEYSGQKFRTRTHTDGGTNPSFNVTYKFTMIDGLREIIATVWNSNTIQRHDYIGSTKIQLSKVIETGYDNTEWSLTNSRTGKSAGVLKLILHFAGARTAIPAAPAHYGQPAPVYSQPPPVYGAAAPAYGPAALYAPQQQSPMPYPPPPVYGPPPVAAQVYGSVYQAPAPTAYPPQPAVYGSYPAQPNYYAQASAPPYTPPPPQAPAYPPAAYLGSGYPQYRY